MHANTFQKSLQVFGEDLSELVISLYIWFQAVQIYGLLAYKVLKHVESRSLILAPTSLRIIEQFEQGKQIIFK